MQSKKLLLSTFAVIILLGLSALMTGVHYLANIAGFISGVGFLLVFFKDPPKEERTEAEIAAENEFKKKWYMVFAIGLLFSILFGSFWNDEFGNM